MSVFVIAEAGVNHGGSLRTALKLADAAKQAGADAVKYQHFDSQRLWGDGRIAHLQLTDAEMQVVAKHCASIGIEFMCTPFGVRECEFLAPLVKRMKVASGCLEKWTLLAAVRATGLPVIMSTGMSEAPRITRAVAILGGKGRDLTLLHCTSAYPCPVDQVNLYAMYNLRITYGKPVGYSDHTQGITVAIAATALGIKVLEKHLTLDRSAEGPDHKASIEPNDFRVMVSAIRTVEEAVGGEDKRLQPAERETARQWYGS